MTDETENVFNNFFDRRTQPLERRFPGRYRALVVETNDPLRMHRIRFKCAELHDFTLRAEDCPWAVPSFDMGNWRSGRWTSPCIGDYVWIEFEKGHPYAPTWTGIATPTRRKAYALPSVYGKTPRPVDAQSKVVKEPQDYQAPYMPKDERPMSHGWQDRYGSMDIHNAVGFFPSTHKAAPPPADLDALSQAKFNQSSSQPVFNDPDSKYMLRASKYGNVILQSDIGYKWHKQGQEGEFLGDFEQDEQFEIDRWFYLQRVIHEDQPKDWDQRKLLMMTRYGHRLEMRDVGWWLTRDGEYGTPGQTIGDPGKDQRWMKMRTKGGHLIEAIDVGFHKEDDFVTRSILDEVKAGEPLDREDAFGQDARQIRLVTRSGRKVVLDDRHSNVKKAQLFDLPNSEIGMGVLIKGRATPAARNNYEGASGNPTGYYFEINERPGRNAMNLGSPLGLAMELNDNNESIIIASRFPQLPRQCAFLEDNEFLESSVDAFDVAHNSHHFIIDHQRELIRLKSRARKGQWPEDPRWGKPTTGEHQGLEIHDAPEGDAWVELVDADGRGLWFSQGQELGVWRAKKSKDICIWISDGENKIVINNAHGKIHIGAHGPVNITAETISLQAQKTITMKAGDGINFQVGGGRFAMDQSAFDTNADVRGKNIMGFFPQIQNGDGGPPGAPSGSGKGVSNIKTENTPTVTPGNRL
jgi:hypothetical protein